MQIIRNPDPSKILCENTVVTIGNFDGVHNGHREIFRRMTEQCALHGYKSIVVTFEPHPLAILAPHALPAMITTSHQKSVLIGEEGIDFLVIISFTPDFSMTPADEFVRLILHRTLGMKHIIIGHDYRFGAGRRGNFETLAILGRELGFTMEDTEPVGRDGIIYSSSLARRLIAEGNMEQATLVLGKYHMIGGKVIHGREIGRAIGFPTANITTENELLPQDGVYAVFVRYKAEIHNGACSIGVNPTFAGGERSIEVFLLDFSGDLYGEEIDIFFVQRLRGVLKFTGAEELVKAINYDIAVTRMILATADKMLCKPERRSLDV